MNWEIISIFLTFFEGLAFFVAIICFAVAAIKFIIRDTRAKRWFRFAEINLLFMLVLLLTQIASESPANLFKVLVAVAFSASVCFIGKRVYKFAKK